MSGRKLERGGTRNGWRAGERGGALGVLLGWVMTLLLLALALEGILRLSGLRPVVTINEPDPELGWAKRKNESTRKVTSEFDVTFSINPLGLRDDADLTLAKPAGTQRVLVVGDSFVLGYTVERHDHFVDLVERALVADGRKVQLLNGGTEGYSTDQEVAWLRRDGFAFAPDIVVACFFQNDAWMNGKTSYSGTPKPRFALDGTLEPAAANTAPRRGWLATRTALFGLVDTLQTSMRYGKELAFQEGGMSMPMDEVVMLRTPPAAVADCWTRTAAGFRELKKSCDEKGAKLLLVAIPTREEIEPGALARWCDARGVAPDAVDPQSPAQKALALASAAGIATLDPKAALVAAAKDGTKVYFEKDWHLNPAGSRVLARQLYDTLAAPALLGGAPTPAGDAAFDFVPDKPMARWPFVLGAVWLLLSTLYARTNRDESTVAAFLQVGVMIASVVAIVAGFSWLIGLLGPRIGRYVGIALLVGFGGWLLFKMGSKLSIIREVYGAFLRNGLWYMIPLIVVMLSIGGLLVVASSSPFIAPFIYTLF